MKTTIGSLLCAFPVALVLTTGASAHHAVQAQFDVQQLQTFTGVMTEVELINPHPYFHLDVDTGNGQIENWSVESVALQALRRAGLLKQLRVGQTFTIEAHPSRNGEPIFLMVAITLPDGNRLTMRSLDPSAVQ
jgi:hypothetical protein